MLMSDVLDNAVEQDKGAMLELVHPVTGAATGLKLWIAGPDSDTARRAEIALADELADMADEAGMVTGDQRAKARLNALARLVLRWEVADEEGMVIFSQKNLLQLLKVNWVRQQVDAFGDDRSNYMATR
jgi:hypothetical protein